jgi:hypothetical protein
VAPRQSALRMGVWAYGRMGVWAYGEAQESDPPGGHALKVRLNLTFIPDIPFIERVKST